MEMIGPDCRRSQNPIIGHCTRSSSENANDLSFIWRTRIGHSARGKYSLRRKYEERRAKTNAECGMWNAEWGRLVEWKLLDGGRGGGNAECGFRIAEWGISECGIEEVVSGQSSVVSRVFSGDPKGSAGEFRTPDCGMGYWEDRSVVKFRAARGVKLTKAVSRWENTVLPNEPNSSQDNGVHDVSLYFAQYGVVVGSSGV